MKYEIILTEQADTDLRSIYEYIAFTHNFIVFYIPKIKDKAVTVIRVLYGGMDIDKQFRKTNI